MNDLALGIGFLVIVGAFATVGFAIGSLVHEAVKDWLNDRP